MNLLQSFMGCMYPGSIRTESIESMDHDFPDYRFQVANIDTQGNEVSRGELQLTDKDLIYFRPGKFPTRWPIGYIRRYGCSNDGSRFLFEAGRRCPTGEAIFAFRLSRGTDLVGRLKDKIDRFSQIQTNVSERHDELMGNQNLCYLTQQASEQPSNDKISDQVPHLVHCEPLEPTKLQNSKDASTSTHHEGADPRPLPGNWLSYASIDFDISKALSETKQAHAASRVR